MPVWASADDHADNPEDDEPIFTGLIDVGVGFRRLDSSNQPGSNDEHFSYGAGGRVNLPLIGGASAQVDLQSEIHEEGGEDSPEGAHMVTGHLSWRNDLFLVGAFAGGGQAANTESNDNTTGFAVGGEAQAYLGDFTLYSQAGYGHFQVDEGEGFHEGWFVGLEGRYFFREDYGFKGGFAYGETDEFLDGDDKGEIWNWDAEVFGRVTQRYPIYGTLAYQGGRYDATSDNNEGDDHRIIFGARFLFGAKTAKENDRRGATLSGPMLPARTASWTESLD